MELTAFQVSVLNHIRYGRSNPTLGIEIARSLGFKNDRAVRSAILELVEAGYPIVSASKPPFGYYQAQDWQELNAYIEMMLGRIKQEARHIRALRNAAKTAVQPKQAVLI